MDFRGAAVRLQASDFAEALKIMPGVEPEALWAVIDVETGGTGFKNGRPDALFERHIFWRELADNTVKQSLASNLGLAYPRWRTRPYPSSSAGVYQEIDAACAIDENAALRSTSWGLGQIMGSEFKEAGYRSAREMVMDFMAGEFQQLAAMVRLIKARGLDVALARHDWATFAKRYNGAGYKANAYDTKLAGAYERRRDGKGPTDYRGLQANLKALGYYSGEIDGKAGPVTHAAVVQFQHARGLTEDGAIDAALIEAVAKAVNAKRPSTPPVIAPPPAKAKVVVTPPQPLNPAHSAGGGAVLGTAAGYFSGNLWIGVGVAVAVLVLVELVRHMHKRPSP